VTRAGDRPGPHPENQRKRRELQGPRRSLIGMLAIAAGLALADAFAARSAIETPLLVIVAATQAIACALLAMRTPRARRVALAAALFAIAFGALEILGWDRVTWFQLALLGTGALESLLVAGCTPRDVANKPRRR